MCYSSSELPYCSSTAWWFPPRSGPMAAVRRPIAEATLSASRSLLITVLHGTWVDVAARSLILRKTNKNQRCVATCSKSRYSASPHAAGALIPLELPLGGAQRPSSRFWRSAMEAWAVASVSFPVSFFDSEFCRTDCGLYRRCRTLGFAGKFLAHPPCQKRMVR